jgi:hypothetical protein
MPTKPAKFDPDHRRALDLLAASRDGCPETLFMAHGFTAALVETMIAAGHVDIDTRHMRAGGRVIAARRLRITEAGRWAIREGS